MWKVKRVMSGLAWVSLVLSPAAAGAQTQMSIAMTVVDGSFFDLEAESLESALCEEPGVWGPIPDDGGGVSSATAMIIRTKADDENSKRPPDSNTLSPLGPGNYVAVLTRVSGGASDPVQLFDFRVEKLCLTSPAVIELSCGTWALEEIRLEPGVTQPDGWLEAYQVGPDGGAFAWWAPHHLELRFVEENEETEVTMQHQVELYGHGQWASIPGPGGVDTNKSSSIDTDCDGVWETTVPATGPFHPGWLHDGTEPEEALFCTADVGGGGQLCNGPFLVQEEGDPTVLTTGGGPEPSW